MKKSFITSIYCIYYFYFCKKYMLWYSLETPHRGASNKYLHSMFLWRNKKNISIFFVIVEKSALSGAKIKCLMLCLISDK